MNENPGLSRRELEHEARWLLKQASLPAEGPTKEAVEALVNVVITLIDKNNAALARSFELRESPDVGDGF